MRCARFGARLIVLATAAFVGPTSIRAADMSVAELAAKGHDSTVVISVAGRDGERSSLGTGFVIAGNGLIATNLHVIGEARPISVTLADGRHVCPASTSALCGPQTIPSGPRCDRGHATFCSPGSPPGRRTICPGPPTAAA